MEVRVESQCMSQSADCVHRYDVKDDQEDVSQLSAQTRSIWIVTLMNKQAILWFSPSLGFHVKSWCYFVWCVMLFLALWIINVKWIVMCVVGRVKNNNIYG